ncbi:cyclic nucleotide-gated channel beta-1-like [Erythrolamprus reginae]|uniref:cyclic nucleotide-gated channel beta-1-like n=1 Tax=Erythrolamprus reginae TaxID=121349 RepID=UPI00396C9B90
MKTRSLVLLLSRRQQQEADGHLNLPRLVSSFAGRKGGRRLPSALLQSLLDLGASLDHPVSESLLGQRCPLPLIQPSVSARMFDWIEKVVPQPPVKIHVSVVEEKDAPVEQGAAVDRPELAKKLPEGDCCNPAEASIPEEGLGTVELWLLRERAGPGLLFWLSQRLQKTIPQLPESSQVPDAKTLEASFDVPDETEIQSFQEEEEELAITVLESEEESEVQSSSSDSSAPVNTNGGKVFTWLIEGFEKLMPQPENKRKAEERTPGRAAEGSTDLKGSGRVTSQSEPLPASPPSSTGASSDQQSYLSLPLFPQRPGGHGAQSLFKCFLQGLEKVMPQPVTQAKQDGQQMKSTGHGREEETHTSSMERDAEDDGEILVEVRCWSYLPEYHLGSPPSPERKHYGGQQERRRREASSGGTSGQLASAKVEARRDIANPVIQRKEAAAASAPLVAPAGSVHLNKDYLVPFHAGQHRKPIFPPVPSPTHLALKLRAP